MSDFKTSQKWISVKMKELCTIKTGKLDANAANEDGEYPFFTCSQKISRINSFAFEGEAILLAGNGNFNVKYYSGKFNAYQRTYVLQNFNCYGKYLFLYLLSTLNILTKKNRGSTVKYIRLGDLQEHVVELPPFNEQKRIVKKIERMFEKIDKSSELIEECKYSFGKRREALLSKAFRGDLTREWRSKNITLHDINEWIDEIKSKKIEKKLTGKYKDQLNTSILENLYEVPEEWKWVRLNDLLEKSTYGTSSKTNEDTSGIPVLRMGNIVDGYFDLNDLKYLNNEHEDILKYNIETNDILFNRTNSYQLVGKSSLVTDEMSGNYTFASYLIRIRLLNKDVLASYVAHYINSHLGRKILLSMVTQQVGQANINSQKLASLPIPLPPKEEIIKITTILDKYRSLEEKQKKIMNVEENIEMLKRSILTKAFKGKL